MENSPVKNIPYPSEYEDPYFDTFEDMIEYMDTKSEVQYAPIAGAVSINPDEWTHPPSTDLSRFIKVGAPIRWKTTWNDYWYYGIIRETKPNSFYFNGPYVGSGMTELEVGSPSMVVTKNLFFPGLYQSWGSEDKLFWENLNQCNIWDGPDAFLVSMAVINKQNKSSGYENVNANIRKLGPGGPPHQSTRLFSNDSWQGIRVGQYQPAFAERCAWESYEIRKGWTWDCYVRGLPPMDGEDLSVVFTFVLKGDEEVACPGNWPSVIMTISGMPSGQDWQGLTDGVHTICPDWYTFRADIFGATSWYYSEWWRRDHQPGYTNDRLIFRSRKRDDEGAPFELSSMLLYFGTTGAPWTPYTTTRTYTAFVKGEIKPRLFDTFVLGGVTFTVEKGMGPWQYYTPSG